ncbi:MAG: ATPase, T2SS/T4P/T4SS family [Candidatus Nanopelagicales bacterium]
MTRRRLGDTLVGWGVITPAQLDAALEAQARDGRTVRRRLGRVLVDAGLVTDGAIAAALADLHGLQVVDLDRHVFDPGVARRIPHSIAVAHVVLPLSAGGGVLRVAVADPVDVVALDDLRMRAGNLRLEVVVVAESQLRAKISEVWSQAVAEDALQKFVNELDAEDEGSLEAGDDEGAVAAVHQILIAAVRAGASDVHIEPMRSGVRVRVRIDGTLRPLMSLPRSGHASIVARTKIISGLDIVERRVPQDGRARLRLEGRDRNLRVSTLPTLHGEKIVVRVLSDQEFLPSLTDLGMGLDQELLLQNALHLPQGLVLITGPTGSGKSTTLYSAIRQMIDEERNLITLEDPVEIELPGVAQVQVSDKTGMTFAAGLRSALRQDPDVIMVGEIRDQITAELAVRAALTGHLVLSTLHTNDSASAVIRLVEMGVPSYLVASSLTLTMAQRLVRKPCPECVTRAEVNIDTRRRLGMTEAEASTCVTAVGCHACGMSGYSGRLGLYEMLPITRTVRAALMAGASEQAISSAAATEGFRSMQRLGVDAAAAGLTTPAELLRTLSIDSEALQSV